MDNAAWKYAHHSQLVLDGTFGVCTSRLLLFIALAQDKNGKGVPLAFFLFLRLQETVRHMQVTIQKFFMSSYRTGRNILADLPRNPSHRMLASLTLTPRSVVHCFVSGLPYCCCCANFIYDNAGQIIARHSCAVEVLLSGKIMCKIIYINLRASA